jgi:hypothetical protein
MPASTDIPSDRTARALWARSTHEQKMALLALLRFHDGQAPQPTIPTVVHRQLLSRRLIEMTPARRLSVKGEAVARRHLADVAEAEARKAVSTQ